MGTKVMGSFVLVLVFIVLAHFLAPSHLPVPAKVREIDAAFGKAVEMYWE